MQEISTEFYWRAKGGTDLNTILKDPPPPAGATLVLAISVTITAGPAVFVENFQLEIRGQPLYDSINADFMPMEMIEGEINIPFTILSSVPSGPYTATLRVRGRADGSEPLDTTSRNFQIDIPPFYSRGATMRREQRETLARFIEKGAQVRQTYETLEPRTKATAEEWETEVYLYLEQNLGHDYAVRFRMPNTSYLLNLRPATISEENYKFYLYFNMRRAQLQEFIKELRD